MKVNRIFHFWLILTALFGVQSAFAVSPAIGVASAIGPFVVNSAEVQGNANLFDGSQLRTTKASSQIFLQNGAALTLGIDSAGTIYHDHLRLEQGATKVDNMSGFRVNADRYWIAGGEPATQAVVRLDGDSVQVAALTGLVNVFDNHGALLTRIGAGTASAFQSGASSGQGTATANTNTLKRQQAALYLLLAVVLAGLGLAVDAILQPAPTSR